MFDTISVCIASQNNMHPKGTEMTIFWGIQNGDKWNFVPDGCN